MRKNRAVRYDMKQKNPVVREIFSFFLPIFFEQLCIALCGLLNSASLGSLGSAQVSAFNLIETLNNVLTQIILALGTGVAVVVSQYRGKHDAHGAGHVALSALWLLSGFGVLLTVLILTLQQPILAVVLGRADADVFENGRTFLLVSSLSLPLYMIYSICANAVRGSGEPRKTMVLSILTNSLYALLCRVFVHMGLGMLSPGLALIGARLYGSLHGLMLLRRGNPNLAVPSLAVRRLDFSAVRSVFLVGIPVSVESLIFQGGRLLTQTFVVPLGTEALAANGIANSMANLMLVPGATFQLALVPVVGRHIGSDDPDGARRAVRAGVLSASLMHAVTAFAGFVLLEPFMGLYGQPEGVNAVIRDIMRWYLPIMPFLWGLSFVLPNGLRGAGDVRYPLYVSVGSMLLFRIVLSWAFLRFTDIGTNSIWFGMYVDWIVRSVLFLLRFRSDRWTRMKVV